MSTVKKFQSSNETLTYLHEMLVNKSPWDFIQEKLADFMFEQNGNIFLPIGIIDRLFELNMQPASGVNSEVLLTYITKEISSLLDEESREEDNDTIQNDTETLLPDPSTDTYTSGVITTRDIDEKLHSFDDNPAVINPDGTTEWYKHGMRHRDAVNGPAIIDGLTTNGVVSPQKNSYEYWTDGVLYNPLGEVTKHSLQLDEWFDSNGKLHRDDDLPAHIFHNSTNKSCWIKTWYRHGKCFRERDQPVEVNSTGTMLWFDSNGKLHRDNDLPAQIIRNSIDDPNWVKTWYRHGECFRESDQATEVNSNGTMLWYDSNCKCC